ncbi:hypothetical protein Taro_016610 [Colocasia esculenta]|uniref:Gamma-glutamylcyclotransferase family protein n=1 Tax=Colocasia esculenta TaxID=4460 RepID=A0A843UE93_COLES|nr:hypothetical protein [Colocasia esculenta]
MQTHHHPAALLPLLLPTLHSPPPPPPIQTLPARPPRPGMGVPSEAGADGRGCAGQRTLVFTYGTLKQGFSNHCLVQEMIRSGDASYVGVYRTADRYPLVCGPYRVPFLLNLPGEGQRVWGEVYAVSGAGIARMDELEGTRRGHYERLPILIRRGGEGGGGDAGNEDAADEAVVGAEAYFAHRSYAGDLWKRNGEKGYCVYSEKEARGYIRRKDRPAGTTFLDQIRFFVSSPAE